MRARLHVDSSVAQRGRAAIRSKGVVIGLIGGLVATIVMDLFGGVLLLFMGGPPSISFAIIGDATAAGLALVGIAVAGGTPLGALVHYLVGPVLGAILALAVLRIGALRMGSLKRGIAISVVYVELMSLPLLASAALLLRMTAGETAQWFGVSFVMHLVYGIVLGLIIWYGLHLSRAESDHILTGAS